MTSTCQSVKGSCDLFIEPQLISILVFYNLPHVFLNFYCVLFNMMISVVRKIPDHTSENDWFYNFINVSTLV